MKNAKTLATTALAIVGALAMAGGGTTRKGPETDKARLLLQKTLERTFPQNVVALIMQRSPDNPSVMQRIQVQISRDGKTRHTVIYPLSMEGVETIDDGIHLTTFLPDRNLLLIHESPRLLPNDTKSRMQMTLRNYDLKLAGNSTVAGRPTTIVLANPHSRDLDSRRYYIDDQTGFLLQLETIDQSGKVRLAFQAKAVSYPPEISPEVFVVSKALRNCDMVPFQRPKSIMSPGKGSVDIGFDPIQPRNIPYGFTIQDVQVNESKQWRSVAVRITDGLVKATVYQWPEDGAGMDANTMPGTSADVIEGIRIVVAADVPAPARKRILQAFADAARRAKAEVTGSGVGPFNVGLFLELSLRQISFSMNELPSISITIDHLDY